MAVLNIIHITPNQENKYNGMVVTVQLKVDLALLPLSHEAEFYYGFRVNADSNL